MSNAPPLRLLSLGAGVQSTTLALMAADGLTDRLDGAIFADTGWEPRQVYEHLAQLRLVLGDAGIPLYEVSVGNLRNDALDPAHGYVSIPYYVRNPDGSNGMGRRQCTAEYKLGPIRRKTRCLLGAAAPDFRRVPSGRVAETWIGFSTDEIDRVDDRRDVRYIIKRYPLVELGMDRDACKRWLYGRGWANVAKSACIGCPFHGNAQWRELRNHHPEEWADAVAFDALIRRGGARELPLNGEAFLHRSRLPLAEAPIDWRSTEALARRAGQHPLFDLAEDGDPDGCSPYGCRSGAPMMDVT